MEAIEPTEEAVSTEATESTAAAEPKAATAVTVIAEHALESAPSVMAARVEEETFPLPTHRTKPTEVTRRGSIQVANPATRLRIELVYSAVY